MYEITKLVENLNKDFGLNVNISECETFIYCDKENIALLMRVLKEELKFMMFSGVTSVDYGDDGFEVVYHVTEDRANLLKIKVKLNRSDTALPSITSVWKAAGVQEREIFDLMGIIFIGHNNLKRVLCTDDFDGYPLRKDFVLSPINRF
jgi:NADH-quinone oxidoreductase subunit C